jgi:tetratricopeptide (TPR) repeat protein
MYKLGVNFYETEEAKEALAYFKKSFELMDTLPNGLKLRHLNTIQDLYNHIAIITSDRGGANDQEDEVKNREALEYLNKAQEIYEIVKQHTVDLPQKSIMNNFDKFILKQSKNKMTQDTHFSFYINQGLDLKLLESKYTTTLFVMAQIHQKLNNIDEGMKYCAITMKRQLEANEYQLKDWCVNALTLSEAYLSRELFAQAEYLLYAAHNLIPDKDESEIKEMKAMIQCGIGRYYQRRLEVGIALYSEGSTLMLDKVNQKLVEFPTLAQNWPQVTNMNGLEDAKKLFRLANTQFKKALEVYPLNGFVTEHVTTK